VSNDAATLRKQINQDFFKWHGPEATEREIYMPVKAIPVKRLHCLRCNWDWTPRGPKVVRCPHCKTPYWNQLRKQKKTLELLEPCYCEADRISMANCPRHGKLIAAMQQKP